MTRRNWASPSYPHSLGARIVRTPPAETQGPYEWVLGVADIPSPDEQDTDTPRRRSKPRSRIRIAGTYKDVAGDLLHPLKGDEVTVYDDMWSQAFGDLPLVASELRILLPDRWVRFHSLPESKRYADTEAEYAEILRRQNKLVDEFLCGKPGWMVTTHTPPDNLTELTALLQAEPTQLTRKYRPASFEPNVPAMSMHGWALNWRPGLLNAWFRRIADDERFNTLILDSEFMRLIAPYDGGMDLIVATQDERDQVRQRHIDWLSAHPTGT